MPGLACSLFLEQQQTAALKYPVFLPLMIPLCGVRPQAAAAPPPFLVRLHISRRTGRQWAVSVLWVAARSCRAGAGARGRCRGWHEL